MSIFPAPLAETADSLRQDKLGLVSAIEAICHRIESLEHRIQALLPEPDRRLRLLREATDLMTRFPDPATRPPLYGITIGVKDIFHTDGFITRAGSNLPPELFAGSDAACVKTLRAAGGLVLGKTVTTEFAYREPGPTRNPHNQEHTPGGSSSGSAAAVAAGYCPLAFGTQTVGSVIRPAAFCGIIGFKPSYGRISTEGIIFFSPSVDHVGLFTQDIAGMKLAASLLCDKWRTQPEDLFPSSRPVLGVPEGPYLNQASPEGLAGFAKQLTGLEENGYQVRRLPALDSIELINLRHSMMTAAEMAHVHAEWFSRYESLYRPLTAALIRKGLGIGADKLSAGQQSRGELRAQLELVMNENGIDLWVSPAAAGPAPEGIGFTGDPAMNLPWTHAGLPTLTL
ncbi:MAG: amidase, partial [Candidatus Binatia bacterium]|nr:amidase [Candidatus Binatia bacterium]